VIAYLLFIVQFVRLSTVQSVCRQGMWRTVNLQLGIVIKGEGEGKAHPRTGHEGP
jgi:hypothetical protein